MHQGVAACIQDRRQCQNAWKLYSRDLAALSPVNSDHQQGGYTGANGILEAMETLRGRVFFRVLHLGRTFFSSVQALGGLALLPLCSHMIETAL